MKAEPPFSSVVDTSGPMLTGRIVFHSRSAVFLSCRYRGYPDATECRRCSATNFRRNETDAHEGRLAPAAQVEREKARFVTLRDEGVVCGQTTLPDAKHDTGG
jgi:ribosomal protein L40E